MANCLVSLIKFLKGCNYWQWTTTDRKTLLNRSWSQIIKRRAVGLRQTMESQLSDYQSISRGRPEGANRRGTKRRGKFFLIKFLIKSWKFKRTESKISSSLNVSTVLSGCQSHILNILMFILFLQTRNLMKFVSVLKLTASLSSQWTHKTPIICYKCYLKGDVVSIRKICGGRLPN